MGKKYYTDGAKFDYDDSLWENNGVGGGHKKFQRCYETHPPFKFGEWTIYGGSCSHPMVTDANVYIGFDWSMKLTPPGYPWEPPKPVTSTEVYFHITDGSVPKDVPNFMKLLEWTAQQLKGGKKVHAGCIGGHGRTGLFLAALMTYMTGEKNSIQYVRDHYCQKVVESKEQVDFLVKHFGITPVIGAKEHLLKKGSGSQYTGSSNYTGGSSKTLPFSGGKSKSAVQPVASKKDVWKAPKAV